MAKERVGFLGLGMMGGGMARRIHGAGFDLIVYDVSEAALKSFRERGVRIATSPLDVANNAEIVFACLPAPAVSIEVANEIVKGSAVEVYIENSTVGPDYMAKLADIVGKKKGLQFIDAPVSGGTHGSEAGILSTVLAGPNDAVKRTRPVMDSYAKHIFHVAEKPGTAQIAKLINNMLSTSGTIAAMEGMLAGARAGLDLEELLAFINVSTGRNVATMEKVPTRMLTRKFGGKIQTGFKDCTLFLEQAKKLNMEPYIASRVLEVFKDAMAAGFDKETMRILEFMEKKAGGDVKVKGKNVVA